MVYVKDGFIVYYEGIVWVFYGGMGGEDGVVRFYDSSGDFRGWIDREF